MSFLCCGSSSTPSRSKRAEAEAETRRARIMPVLTPPSPVYAPQYRRRRTLSTSHEDELPPPRYEDINRTVVLSGGVGGAGDNEKDSSMVSVTQQNTQTNTTQHASGQRTHDTVASALSAYILEHIGASSDRSSIISIPSTQVTGLGSVHTGTTTLHGGRTGAQSFVDSSGRPSEDSSSGRRTLVDGEGYLEVRPPSYYATTPVRGSRSSSPDGNGSDGEGVWRHPVMRADWFENLRGTRGDGEWRR